MKPPSNEQMVDALWAAYVKPHVDPTLYEGDRTAAAVAALAKLKAEIDTGGFAERVINSGPATMVWMLLSLEVAGWLPVVNLWNHEHIDDKTDRDRIVDLLKKSENAAPPTHRSAVDPVSILLPRSVFETLLNALQALDKGEVQNVLKPVIDKRREAWNWDRARLRAVQHVLRLAGEGVDKGIARRRVSAALGPVNEETLRAWEKDFRKNGADELDNAYQAGALSAAIRDDPSAWSIDKPADAHAVALMHEFRDEPLFEFGKRYTGAFGDRHRSPVNGGK